MLHLQFRPELLFWRDPIPLVITEALHQDYILVRYSFDSSGICRRDSVWQVAEDKQKIPLEKEGFC